MNPVIAKLLIPLLAGTAQWQEPEFTEFLFKIDIVMSKEDIEVRDIEYVLDVYNKEMMKVCSR